MASRMQQKAAARAAREAAHQTTKQRHRLWIVGGVLGAAIVVAATAVTASSSKNTPGTSIGHVNVAPIERELAGIPQAGNRLGSPSAPVTIAYYGDLECSHCQAFTLQDLPQLIHDDVRTGKAQLVYHSLETASQYNPDANAFRNQQVAAAAAGLQNRAWDYIELFYNQQGAEGTGYVNESYLDKLARQIPGLNYDLWRSDRNVPALVTSLQTDSSAAQSYGINSTPSFYVSGPKGTPQTISGAVAATTIEAAVRDVSA